MLDAYRKNEERARERDAWMLANLLAPWSKKRLHASDFYKAGEDKWEILDRKLKRLHGGTTRADGSGPDGD